MSVVSLSWLAMAGLLLVSELRWVFALHTEGTKASALQNKLTAMQTQRQEYALLQESKAQMALVQGVAEQLIDSTTQTTRETHQKIADVPFTVFESIPATRDAAKAARGVHDMTSTGVYAAISMLNKGVGKGVRGILQTELDKTEKPERLEKSRPDADKKPGDKNT